MIKTTLKNLLKVFEGFGLWWQSAAATPLFDCGQSFPSGVALRFPPQSKRNGVRLCRAAPFREIFPA
jgi:hypothetical protein